MNTSQKVMAQYDKAKEHEHSGKAGLCSFGCGGLMALFFMVFSGWQAFLNPDFSKFPHNRGNFNDPDSEGYPCYAYGCGDPVGKAVYETVETRPCGDNQVPTRAWATSEQFILYFRLMFCASVASFISVVLGCLGTCVPCCGLTGSWAHFAVNWVYFVLMILGSVWRWSSSGRICSADEFNDAYVAFADSETIDFDVNRGLPDGAEWQYWETTGAYLAVMIIFQFLTICCMCCCSFCLHCKNKKDE